MHFLSFSICRGPYRPDGRPLRTCAGYPRVRDAVPRVRRQEEEAEVTCPLLRHQRGPRPRPRPRLPARARAAVGHCLVQQQAEDREHTSQ